MRLSWIKKKKKIVWGEKEKERICLRKEFVLKEECVSDELIRAFIRKELNESVMTWERSLLLGHENRISSELIERSVCEEKIVKEVTVDWNKMIWKKLMSQ